MVQDIGSGGQTIVFSMDDRYLFGSSTTQTQLQHLHINLTSLHKGQRGQVKRGQPGKILEVVPAKWSS